MARRVSVWLSVILMVLASFLSVSPMRAATVEELREHLREKKEHLGDVEARIKKFKEDIQLKKREARSLQDQIAIIEDNIEGLALSIAQTEAEIETTSAEISTVESEIERTEAEIARQKKLLAQWLRQLYVLKQQSQVAIFLKYATFAEAVTEASTYEELQIRSQNTLAEIKRLRDELTAKKADLEQFRERLQALQVRQQQQQATLVANRESKERVLKLTQAQESQYQELLVEAQRAHREAESDIRQIDEQIREELRKLGLASLPAVGRFDWPVEPIFGISCGFHCPGYPYAYLIGPHSGVDIPTNVGTPVKAPADGYVARVHDAGGPGYSYILLLHGENISTVFGHLSGFAVNEKQMVSRGTVIGYTGGAPGTRGAGLSSGPHLHFEVRMSNIPINPMKYL